MRVAKRGMIGPDPTGKNPTLPLRPLEEYVELLTPHIDPAGPGIVDFVVGARPGPGVFVLGAHDHPRQQHYLNLYKLGTGPYYLFYTPYHLCHFEAPLTVARAVLFQDAALAPTGPPLVGVVATAKRDLKPADVIDAIGGFDTYGEAENMGAVVAEGLLPMGLAEGCTVMRPVAQGAPLTWDDVAIPPRRQIDEAYAAQMRHFGLTGGAP
jgi:predicted homoserine dehydrogenase-like protein